MSYLQATNEQRNLGSKWNTSLINAVVLYVGSQAITQINNQNTSPSQETVAHNAYMDIFQVSYEFYFLLFLALFFARTISGKTI